MVEQAERGMLPDEATVTDQLARDVGPDRTWDRWASMVEHVRGVVTTQVSRKRLPSYLTALRSEVERRALVDAARSVIHQHNEGEPTEELRQAMADGLSDTAATDDDTPPTMAAIVMDAAQRAVDEASGAVAGNIVRTGLGALDRTFRMRYGDLVLVGARPSMGKTHFLLSILAHIAQHCAPVQVQSIEMSSDALGDRVFGHAASDGWEEDASLCKAATPEALARWVGPDGDLPVYIDSRSMSIERIERAVYVAHASRGCRVFVVDYLQLAQVQGDAARRNREQEVAHVSRALKRIAKRLSVLVICAVQLNRALEARSDKRPILSDLRDTGQLEQDADGILFLYRDVVYHDEADNPDTLEIGVGKQRNGARGTTVFAHYRPGTGFVRDFTYGEAMGQ